MLFRLDVNIMKHTYKSLVHIIGLTLILAACSQPAGNYEDTPYDTTATDEGQSSSVIDFTVLDISGNQVSLSDYVTYEKPIVINFWTTWCPGCVNKLPDFQNAYDRFGDDVIFMAINITDGQRETKELVEDFIASGGYTFPVYFDTTMDATEAYSVQNIPVTFLLDRQGNLDEVLLGATDETTFLYKIERLLD